MEGWVKETVGNQTMARQCMVAAISCQPSAESATPTLPGNESTEEAKCEDLEKVSVGIDPEKFFQFGSELPPQEKEELIRFLRENVDVFAWDAYEAPRVDLIFIYHHLNANPSVTPKKKPPRCPSKEHANAVRDEVMKLKKA